MATLPSKGLTMLSALIKHSTGFTNPIQSNGSFCLSSWCNLQKYITQQMKDDFVKNGFVKNSNKNITAIFITL